MVCDIIVICVEVLAWPESTLRVGSEPLILCFESASVYDLYADIIKVVLYPSNNSKF